LVAELKTKPKQYLDELNSACNSTLNLAKIKLVSESVRIIVNTAEHRTKLLALTIGGMDIEVTQPWSDDTVLTRPQDRSSPKSSRNVLSLTPRRRARTWA
jgi:hypothetical protein